MSAIKVTMLVTPVANKIVSNNIRFSSRLFKPSLRLSRSVALRVRAAAETDTETKEPSSDASAPPPKASSSELNRAAMQAAQTFAPRASGPTGKNPAYPGSTLYTVFEVQAWLGAAVGALLAFNIIFPTDGPDIPRLLGMWSLWIFSVPSLRARDCTKAEKDALNYAFLAIPLANVALPLVWKSFAAVYSLDVAILVALYAWKGVLPFAGEGPEADKIN